LIGITTRDALIFSGKGSYFLEKISSAIKKYATCAFLSDSTAIYNSVSTLFLSHML
jgi:hypothetical protein